MKSGLWYAFGLVTAVTLTIVWRVLGGPWIRWLFSRGDS